MLDKAEDTGKYAICHIPYFSLAFEICLNAQQGMKSWLSAEADSENGSRQGNIKLSALRTKLKKFSSKIFYSVKFHTLINECSKI